MNKEDFLPEKFFDLSGFEHTRVFVKDQPVWETLKNIKTYISEQFNSGKVKKSLPTDIKISTEGENIFIGEGTKIFPNVYIGNNVIIGKNCEIRPGAFIRGDVIVGNNCVIGNSSELKNCILLNNANTPHYNYVGDSIIGNECNVGAGSITGNLRFDKRNIGIKIDGKLFDTGLRKFGVILGDGCQVGCNAVFNPGTIIGKNCFLGSAQAHQGIIDPDSKAI